MNRENVEELAKAFGIKAVPILITGTIQQAIDYVKTKPNSTVTENIKESEGLIGTPIVPIYDVYGQRVIIKVKVRDFIL